MKGEEKKGREVPSLLLTYKKVMAIFLEIKQQFSNKNEFVLQKINFTKKFYHLHFICFAMQVELHTVRINPKKMITSLLTD